MSRIYSDGDIIYSDGDNKSGNLVSLNIYGYIINLPNRKLRKRSTNIIWGVNYLCSQVKNEVFRYFLRDVLMDNVEKGIIDHEEDLNLTMNERKDLVQEILTKSICSSSNTSKKKFIPLNPALIELISHREEM